MGNAGRPYTGRRKQSAHRYSGWARQARAGLDQTDRRSGTWNSVLAPGHHLLASGC
jgi:hypothetical protein